MISNTKIDKSYQLDGLFNQFSEAMNICSLEDYCRRRSTIKHELFEGFVDALNLVEEVMERITIKEFSSKNSASQHSVFMDAESFAIEKSFYEHSQSRLSKNCQKAEAKK